MILGAPVKQSKGAYIAETKFRRWCLQATGRHCVRYCGGRTDRYFDQATLTDGDSTINLFEQNMFAVRAEIEVGFRCDTSVFNKKLTGKAKTGG